jgi:two-component system KDP operon response regulator KdpE
VDQVKRQVQIEGKDVHLTPIEYRRLPALVRSYRSSPLPSGLQEALRRKLERDPARPRFLLTEPGVGYRLAAE